MAISAEGSSTARINSCRGNLSPIDHKSGPAFPLLPSTEWHLTQAARCSSLNNSRPRATLPSCPKAKSRYSRSGRAGSAEGFPVAGSAPHAVKARAKANAIGESHLHSRIAHFGHEPRRDELRESHTVDVWASWNSALRIQRCMEGTFIRMCSGGY